MTYARFWLVGVAVVTGFSLTACAPAQPKLHPTFGDSLTEARRQQTLHPDAPVDGKPVTVLSGLAGKNVSESYAKGFEPREEGKSSMMFLGLEGIGGGK